ncbi:Glu-tRNA(Gln) amidotransferase subunit GatE [Candidatus Bathyarchaeota archaeon]|jgi:glutamyl-tRNA(Gln) amidotransferase subunit E|nr:Glu-tRNA(Gln) amidotransferase subunit GatE [Candidatus Bathyarchaeota archaeon]
MDYKKIGLTIGIEIHQELATETKLFCNCPPELNKDGYDFTFTRKLRPAQSELGEIDPAALFEFLKGKTIIYEADHRTSCLVEMDEEPPSPMDEEAVGIALTFSLMTKGTPVDEVQIMRKTVVDGSNTGGFQRTSVVSLGGEVEVGGKTYRLEQVAVEEDAARKMSEDGETITYRLDRLGIPLIEITTAPEMHTPQEAYDVARRIGSILRATGKVRRGIGTIRQDVNVSIMNGGIIEIKGAQDLGMIKTLVEFEAQRQATLIEIQEELITRGVIADDLEKKLVDVSEMFVKTESKILLNALKRGGKVYAVRLKGFNGLTGKELCPNRRLGTEMSDHAKFMGGVRGIFHTDELPGYKITQEEVKKLREEMGAEPSDAVVIVADDESSCKAALIAVVDRAVQALSGVPAETRSANQDGTTRFTRPRPGAARMYPETDVRPTQITTDVIITALKNLPDMPEVKLTKYKKRYELNDKLAIQILDSEHLDLFEELAELGLSTTLLAVTLTEDLTKLRRDGVPTEDLSQNAIRETFMLVKDGTTVKESIPDMLTYLAKNPTHDAEKTIKELGLEMMSDDEVKHLVESAVKEREALVKEKGMKAMGPLMGVIMGKARGKASPQQVNKLLNTAIRAIIE